MRAYTVRRPKAEHHIDLLALRTLVDIMAENRNHGNTWVAGVGFGLLTVNSGLAIYRAWGDPASVLFVAGSYLTLLLLFACLRAYELAPPRSPAGERARRWRAVWPLPTLLTMAFAWKVAAFMPSSVAAAVVCALAVATVAGGFIAVWPSTAPRAGGGGRPVSSERQVAAALVMVTFGVMTCDTALDVHDALGDLCSATTTLVLVGVAYAAYLALTFRFVRAFAGRARAAH
ncbi:unnamed protein product [Urochloa decumbens]|uniref:Uncharacterized protein n=1 Tax=Urochloa decumbens TaxID=240449 RepID=A0ABC9DYN9_9POAL